MTLAGLPAQWWGLVKQVATSWLDDYVPSMGAALACYTMFSLARLLWVYFSDQILHHKPSQSQHEELA